MGQIYQGYLPTRRPFFQLYGSPIATRTGTGNKALYSVSLPHSYAALLGNGQPLRFTIGATMTLASQCDLAVYSDDTQAISTLKLLSGAGSRDVIWGGLLSYDTTGGVVRQAFEYAYASVGTVGGLSVAGAGAASVAFNLRSICAVGGDLIDLNFISLEFL